jgi:glycosyltransferase involved in cell wall biosynthesis
VASNTPLVSVIIPTYNRAHLITEAVESVLAQTYQNFELIVVDDGSTDNTGQVLRSFGSKIQLISQNNLGVAEARNIGIKTARGVYIAFLDADDLWLPDKLSSQIGFLDQNPNIEIVYCDVYLADERGRIFSCIHAHHTDHIFPYLLQKNIVVGSASSVMLRRTCFEKTGLFDPMLDALEDWDMWLRLAACFRFGLVPRPLVEIRVQKGGRTQDAGIEGHRRAMAMMYTKLMQNSITRQAMPTSNNPERFIQALIHMNTGNRWLAEYNNADQARQEFFTAICLCPTMRCAYIGLFKSLIGSHIAHQLWRLKWRLIGFFR